MHLDIDCILDILLIAEKCTYNAPAYIRDVKTQLCNYFDNDIAAACYELYNAGCIYAVIKRHTMDGTVVKQIRGITPKGRKVLEKLNDSSILNKVKKQLPGIALDALSLFIQQLLS